MAAVRASGLVKRFESTRAVDGVDLLVQTMRAAGGDQVVNPLFVFYGCLNPL